jgi:hypothetical protein
MCGVFQQADNDWRQLAQIALKQAPVGAVNPQFVQPTAHISRELIAVTVASPTIIRFLMKQKATAALPTRRMTRRFIMMMANGNAD